MSTLWVSPQELSGSLSSEPDAAEACQIASFILWGLSGRRYTRTRTVTERYECACRSDDRGQVRGIGFNVFPVLDDGSVKNLPASGCGCSTAHARLRLRGTPVRTVQTVLRGSEEVSPGSYRVLNSVILELDSGDACGLTVTYTHGTGIPAAGRAAARKLAEELLKGWIGDEECSLPARTTNVSREGISFTIIDKQDFLDDLRTGIYEVDLFLRAVNPDKARAKARVFSPDMPKAYRVTAAENPAAAPVQGDGLPVLDGGFF